MHFQKTYYPKLLQKHHLSFPVAKKIAWLSSCLIFENLDGFHGKAGPEGTMFIPCATGSPCTAQKTLRMRCHGCQPSFFWAWFLSESNKMWKTSSDPKPDLTTSARFSRSSCSCGSILGQNRASFDVGSLSTLIPMFDEGLMVRSHDFVARFGPSTGPKAFCEQCSKSYNQYLSRCYCWLIDLRLPSKVLCNF